MTPKESKMNICCCWLYAISKYGYPPSMENTFRVIREMKEMGFEQIELEGVGEKNLMEVYENRAQLKSLCDTLGLEARVLPTGWEEKRYTDVPRQESEGRLRREKQDVSTRVTESCPGSQINHSGGKAIRISMPSCDSS
jgi:hypothetical protein